MSMPSGTLTLRDIYRARQAVASQLVRTPLVLSPVLSHRVGARVILKLESLQHTGSFKTRGVMNRLLRLNDAERERGVVTVSTGNHGRAMAYAAGRLGIRAVVYLSQLVPENKLQAIREFGAEVRIIGKSQDEALVEAERLATHEGMVMVHPFDDPFVIAGQGTIGLEILEDMPEVDTVMVPVSGGGLISGVAVALKSAAPDLRVVGISMERGAAMYHSQRAGKPVLVEEQPSLADSLGGGIGLDNRYTFTLVRDYVDDFLLVSEEEIAQAMVHAYVEERLVTEGAGVVGIAALLSGRRGDVGGSVVTVISGSNVDMDAFSRVVSKYVKL